MEEKLLTLIQYGLDKAGWPVNDSPSAELNMVNWAAYERALGSVNSQTQLQAILSLVHLEGQSPPHKVFYSPRELTLTSIMPGALDTKEMTDETKHLDELNEIKKRYQNDIPLYFHSFYHLYRKFEWAVCGTCGGAGISLFEQWKAIAAMVLASGGGWKTGPDNEFTLIGGDIPGIQDFVYTITSKGAAKGLRGRSFFVQLLGEAVIQRILVELGLYAANIIYAAGGNFMLIAPKMNNVYNGKSIAELLNDMRDDIESALLSEFHGDLSCSLAWTPLSVDDIGTHNFASGASRLLKEEIASHKRSRFSSVAINNWESLFAPQGKAGNRYCAICQVPLAKGEGKELPGQHDVPMEDRVRSCVACDSFGELARTLGRARFLSISSRRSQKPEKWQEVLFKVSKSWFSLGKDGEKAYLLNDTDFIKENAQGFRFMANVTPHVTKEDIKNWNAADEDEHEPRPDDVRTFSQIASSSRGIKNIGVLRMDVDNLGLVMVKGLVPRTLVATSSLSAGLDLFFSGYLNNLCREIEYGRAESMYIIYAGGDDLFIIGAWDLMIPLAEKIQSEFSRYTGNNPSLAISGAVTLEGRKFPLYQAAERAGGAEDKAKAYERSGIKKNAFHFLGMSIGWEEWEQVKGFRQDIENALNGGASKSLIQIIQNIYSQYEEQRKKFKVVFGPWMWRGAYALSRMAGRNNVIREAISRLAKTSLDSNQIRFAGLAARWIELLNRKES